VTVDEYVALLGGAALFLGGVGGFLVQAINARNSAKRSDLDAFKLQSDAHVATDRIEFDHLVSEVVRLEKALDRRRVEIETLFAGTSNLHAEMEAVRVANSDLRIENSKLKDRTAELEGRVTRLTNERDSLIQALSNLKQAVDVVGTKADDAYAEANHSNRKLQAVLDAGNIAAGLSTVDVTSSAAKTGPLNPSKVQS
jgi:chromosome segregation ATPase